MTNHGTESSTLIDSWDTYWRGAQASAAYTSGGSSHPLVSSFWSHYFSHLRDDWDSTPKIIDIASGNGAVVESASTIFAGDLPDFTCLDVSESAIRMLEERFPGVHGIVADAADIPLAPADFDIVTSQYGVEYAGLEALDGIMRLVAPGGELTLLLHHRDGSIYAQCDTSFHAISELQASGFIPKCIAMFESGFEALKGRGRDRYSAAGKAFAPAIQKVEAIMTEHGNQVADGTILRLYRDVRDVHANMPRYEPADVLGWLEKMQDEIAAYGGRMASMCSVAIDVVGFEQLRADIAEKEFDILRAEPLSQTDEEPPLAWALVAKKR